MLKPTEKIWRNGELIDWNDATIHVLSHVVSYGSSVFEGIRCYETASGPAIFRLNEHVRRLVDSARIYRMDTFRFSAAELADARESGLTRRETSAKVRARTCLWCAMAS
jgi:branched-chain amino acid aminotransferase